MNIIRPTTITAAMLHSSNVPETDYSEYAAGTTYADGDKVIVAADHKVYESLQNANKGNTPSSSPTWWLDSGKTNRWKPWDNTVSSQASQAAQLMWVLEIGAIVDSISMHNLDATSAQIILADQANDLITNGTAWTGATGTTQPTGWDKVGTPSDFTIDSGALKITADAANEGVSKTITVEAGKSYQLLGVYRNTADDIAQFAVYDESNAEDIAAVTDLASSEVDSTLSHVFTAPAGCTSVTIKLLAKSASDIVWFDNISVAPVEYDETITLLNTVSVIDWYSYFFEPIAQATDLVKTDLATVEVPPISTASITLIVNNTGGAAKVGEIVLGLKFNLGKMKYRPGIGINDYSVKSTDAFGNITLTPGSYSKKLTFEMNIHNTIVDEVVRQLTLYRATAVVWIGSEEYASLIVYGFFRSFDITIPYPEYSICNLEIEGLT